MSILVVIPARGGSKGLPGKNIKLLQGKPLIHYTIEVARKIFNDDEILVSSESSEIIEVAQKTGIRVPYLRPQHLSTDHASSEDMIKDALLWYENTVRKVETVILLQPTSPFRSESQILEALDLYDSSVEMVVSTKVSKSNPYFNLFEEDENGFLTKVKQGFNFSNRQECPPVYEYNGAIYIFSRNSFLTSGFRGFTRIRKYVMNDYSSIDIDTSFDWIVAEALLKNKLLGI